MKRSRLSITTQLGWFGESEFPAEVIADATEAGETRIEIRPHGDWSTGPEAATAYLSPTDAAVLGHQLIEASRSAAPSPPGDSE